jgi:hypothetical protein
MDTRELNNRLSNFKAKCTERHFPLTGFDLKAAYPGDDSTSYFIEVKASWIADTTCSDAIDHLVDILYDTTDEETRRHVFAIKILDSRDRELSPVQELAGAAA